MGIYVPDMVTVVSIMTSYALLKNLENHPFKVLTEKLTPDKLLNTTVIPVMEPVVVVPELVGVMNGVPIMVIVVQITLNLAQLKIPVMETVTVVPDLAGVMISVLVMVIVVLIMKISA